MGATDAARSARAGSKDDRGATTVGRGEGLGEGGGVCGTEEAPATEGEERGHGDGVCYSIDGVDGWVRKGERGLANEA
jgi:hypothetical protein